MKNMYFCGLLLLMTTSILFGVSEEEQGISIGEDLQKLVNHLHTQEIKELISAARFKLGETEYKKLYNKELHSLNNQIAWAILKNSISDDEKPYMKDLCHTHNNRFLATYVDASRKLPFFSRIYFLYIRPCIPYKIMK